MKYTPKKKYSNWSVYATPFGRGDPDGLPPTGEGGRGIVYISARIMNTSPSFGCTPPLFPLEIFQLSEEAAASRFGREQRGRRAGVFWSNFPAPPPPLHYTVIYLTV